MPPCVYFSLVVSLHVFFSLRLSISEFSRSLRASPRLRAFVSHAHAHCLGLCPHLVPVSVPAPQSPAMKTGPTPPPDALPAGPRPLAGAAPTRPRAEGDQSQTQRAALGRASGKRPSWPRPRPCPPGHAPSLPTDKGTGSSSHPQPASSALIIGRVLRSSALRAAMDLTAIYEVSPYRLAPWGAKA